MEDMMANQDLAQAIVHLVASAAASGAIQMEGNTAWATVQQRLGGDRTAAATLVLFESDTSSADMQRRLAAVLVMHFNDAELEALHRALGGTTPHIRSRISADEDALIQGSGHKVLAPPGSVDLATTAGKRGRIINSPITIAGVGTPSIAPSAAHIPPRAPVSARPPLPATLSADGVHFTVGHALLIGVGSYAATHLCVPGGTTANDARALATLLRDPQIAAYPDNQVRVLLDTQATKAQILAELEALAQRVAASPGSTALIFFAGHGASVGDSYALLPYDVESNNKAATAVTADLFHQAIARVRAHARRLVVILNCCHAGGVGDAVLDAEDDSAPPPDFYRPLAQGSGQVVISSSRPGQKSGARSPHNPQHSTFGAQLLDALNGDVAGQGPGIGIFELFTTLRLRVPPDAATIPYKGAPLQQEPLFYASQLDDNIVIALRPPTSVPTLSDNSDAIARLIAVELQIELAGDTVTPPLIAERDAFLVQLAL